MNLFGKLFMDGEWNIAFRQNTSNGKFDYNEGFTSLRHDNQYWFADPMAYETSGGGRTLLFCEAFRKKDDKGILGVFDIEDGKTSDFHVILEEPYHLSYPCVFCDTLLQRDGRYYLIPESGEHESLDLYVAVVFPYKWEKMCSLVTGKMLADTTVFIRNNEYWLYSYEKQTGGYEAHLYKLDLSKCNVTPVLSRSYKDSICRPGGYFKKFSNSLICPIQDCREAYGKTLIFKSMSVSEEALAEQDLFTIDTAKIIIDGQMGVDRVHTYTCTSGMEFIDYNNFKFDLFKRLKIIKRRNATYKRLKKSLGTTKNI